MFLLIRMWVFRIVLIEIYLLVQKSSLSDIAMEFYEAKTAKKGQNRPNLAVFGQNRHAKFEITLHNYRTIIWHQ